MLQIDLNVVSTREGAIGWSKTPLILGLEDLDLSPDSATYYLHYVRRIIDGLVHHL